jgi:hypothetical protein
VTDLLFSRRDGIMTLALGAGVLLAPMTGARAASIISDDLRTYLRIRSRLDGKAVFYPYRGTVFGKEFGQSTVPLFDVEGFSWDRLTAVEDGRYRIDTAEAGYFLNRQTGLPLSNWVNPMNGAETEVKHYRSFAHVAISDGKLEPILAGAAPTGLEIAATMSEQTRINGKIWIHEDIIAKIPNKPQSSFADPREYVGPMIEGTSLATWSADIVHLADERRNFVPAMFSYQTLGSWRPFMRMGATPGAISWRIFGTKAPTIDQVPPALRARVLREYPDFLTRSS